VKKVLVVIVLLLVPAISIAKPTADSAKEVQDYFWNGDGPLLVEYKICSEVAKEGENKNECVTEVDPSALVKGDKVVLWMNYMVPQDTEQKVSVLVMRNNRPEKTSNINLPGSLRIRTWATLPTDKEGSYSIQLDHEIGDNFNTLKKLSYQVSE